MIYDPNKCLLNITKHSKQYTNTPEKVLLPSFGFHALNSNAAQFKPSVFLSYNRELCITTKRLRGFKVDTTYVLIDILQQFKLIQKVYIWFQMYVCAVVLLCSQTCNV